MVIGQTLGPYQIKSLLGRGGMGEVYRATDTRLGRDVALKILPTDVQADPDRRGRFEREARAIAAIDHPNVVTVHAVEEIEGRLVLTMELVEGRTLGEEIPETGLPLARLLELAVPMADALAAAHARGVTHRDLKPDNVMVDRSGRIRVLDFGLAKVATALDDDRTVAVEATAEGRVLGTTSYMSPEQAEGKHVDPRSDVFSLGVLLYQMASGQRPFVGDTPISTITSILRDEPVPVGELKPDLPTQLGRIVRRCLEKDPEQRYETAKGLKFDLENLREDSSAHAPGPARPDRRPARRIPIAIAALVAIVAVVLGVRQFGGSLETGTADPNTSATTGTSTETRRIVVFPFENLGEPADAFFARGVSEEIASRLTALPDVGVVSRSSARQYDRTGRSMLQIADDLGVEFVLEGTVRWLRDDAGSRVRVSPVLVNANEDQQIWAENYDRRLEEILAIQSEVANAVATQIGTELSPDVEDVETPTKDIQAYIVFLRGRQLLTGVEREGWEEGTELLENAVERDPSFGRAWAALAVAHAGFVHYAFDRSDERIALAERAAARAREVDPDAVWTHRAAGYVAYHGKRDYDTATAAFERAHTLRPEDAETMGALGFVLRRRARYDEALEWILRARDAEPSDWNHHANAAETLGILRRYDEARAAIDRAIELRPQQPLNYEFKCVIEQLDGRLDVALDTIDAVPNLYGLGESAYLKADLELALLDYDAALDGLEDYPDYLPKQFKDSSRWHYEAQIRHLRDGPEVAAPYYERAIAVIGTEVERRPEDANPTSLLALALAGSGAHDEAIALAQQALTMAPADSDLWQRDNRYWDLANVYLWAGRPEDAEPILRDLCNRPGSIVSREFLQAAPQYGRNSPLPAFAAVADFDL